MFNLWLERKGKKATPEKLVSVLRSFGSTETADRIERHWLKEEVRCFCGEVVRMKTGGIRNRSEMKGPYYECEKKDDKCKFFERAVPSRTIKYFIKENPCSTLII